RRPPRDPGHSLSRTVSASWSTLTPGHVPGLLPRAGSAGAAADSTDGDGAAVYRFDFEDGALPDVFFFGHVVPAVVRPGSKYAVMATICANWGAPITLVSFSTEGLTFRDGLILSFDYWMGLDGHPPLTICVRDANKEHNYCEGIAAPVRERW